MTSLTGMLSTRNLHVFYCQSQNAKCCEEEELKNLMSLHYVVIVPQDAVVMKTLCGIKPQVKLLFPSCANASIPVHVCLQDPFPSLLMPEQLKINLVVVVREDIRIG